MNVTLQLVIFKLGGIGHICAEHDHFFNLLFFTHTSGDCDISVLLIGGG